MLAPSHTYLNGSAFQPATAVNILGMRSLAGLIPYPALHPKLAPIATTSRPTIKGAISESGALFRLSDSAKIVPTRSAVPTTYNHGYRYIDWKRGNPNRFTDIQ